MRVYTDEASGRHVNHVARIEAEERFPAALAGVHLAKHEGIQIEWCPCGPAPEDVLTAVHDPAYLGRVREMSEAGGGYFAPDTGLNEHSWDSALLASGAAVGAVESVLDGTAAFAVARPPGHHAGSDYAMGFCLLNHAAVAAEYTRSRGVGRVAILDWDVHHGNGTQDIFYDDGEVLYLSVHQSPFYPGTGAVEEVGEGDGRGFTVNVPLPRGSTEEEYGAVFEGVFLPVLREFCPEIIIVSAGFDAHAADPIGGMRLSSESFGRFAARVTILAHEIGAAPPALILEGGYNLEALSESVAATIKGVENSATEGAGWNPTDLKPVEVEASRKALAPFWEALR